MQGYQCQILIQVEISVQGYQCQILLQEAEISVLGHQYERLAYRFQH
jgi:hypothetical protein